MLIKRTILAAAVLVLIGGKYVSGSEANERRPMLAAGSIKALDAGNTVNADFKIYKDTSENGSQGILAIKNAGHQQAIKVEIRHVTVDGKYSWFAGKCISDPEGKMTGQWLLVVVHDDGAPGQLVDHIWWQWLAAGDEGETRAVDSIQRFAKPKVSLDIRDGDIEIFS